MSTERLRLDGIFPPIPTPFSGSGSLDLQSLTRHVENLNLHPLSGLVVLGSNGEAVHLSREERVQVTASARQALAEGRQLIAGSGCHSSWETIELSNELANVGADAVLVLPPHYYRDRMTPRALIQYFHEVAEASQVPVVVYNMPACTGIDLDSETIVELSEHPNIVGLKDSSGQVAKLADLHHRLGDRLQLLAGSAGFLLPALSVGACGGVLALANIAPDVCLAIFDAFLSGDLEQARVVQARIVRANTAVTKRFGVSGLKAAMARLGLPGGCVRSPLLPLSESDEAELETILIEAELLIR